MTIRLRLVVIIVLAALVPLSISAWTTLGIHRRAIDERVRALQVRTGEQAAAVAAHTFDDGLANVERLVRSVPWAALSPAERDAAPWLVYRQVDDVAAVLLLDEHGRPIGPGAAVAVDEPAGDLAGHPRWSAAAGQALVAAAAGAPEVVGEALMVPGGERPLVPIVLAIDDGGPVRRVLVARALDRTCAAVAAVQSPALEVRLVDAGGRLLCGEGVALTSVGERADHERTRAASTRGWSVVIDQDVALVRAPSRQILARTLWWLAIGFVAALGAGLFLGRRIVRPVEALARGAAELGGGNVGYRIPDAGGADELARLSGAFNQMGVEIARRDAALQAWNERLQELVDARTRELAEVHEQLVRSQRVTAVGSLGAGFAHEINNPLTGLLGITQVMLDRARRDPARAGDARLLESMEKEGRRIADVVTTLCRLSADEVREGGHVALDVNRVVDDTVALVERRVAGRAVALIRDQAPALPPVLGDAQELQQVLLHLIDNALQAMEGSGRLAISTEVVDGHVIKLAVSDSGAGIAPAHLSRIFDPFFTTKQSWRAHGLGLTTAFRIVEKHHGMIRVHSVVDEGTTMTVSLPAAPREAHLV